MSTSEFQALVKRAREGDPAAAGELVRQYEPAIRRAIRIRLVEPRLQRYLDSGDICQSVIRRALSALGDDSMPADDPVQFVAWLVRVARNRFNEALRRLRVVRAHLEQATEAAADLVVNGAEDPPAERLANRELIELVCGLLTPEERVLAERYSQGVSWDEIGDSLGVTAGAARKRFFRAIERAAGELGLRPDPG
jgi:RNA polymerase sigma factor (sigma-70 family)